MTDRATLKAEILAGFKKAILAITDHYIDAYEKGQQIEIFVERSNEGRAVFGIGVRESEAKKAGKQ